MALIALWLVPEITAGGPSGSCGNTSAPAASLSSYMTKPRRYGTTSSRIFQRTAWPTSISFGMGQMLDNQGMQAYLRSLPAHEAIAVKQRLDQLRRDCGCRVGGIMMLTITTTWIVFRLLFPVVG